MVLFDLLYLVPTFLTDRFIVGILIIEGVLNEKESGLNQQFKYAFDLALTHL